MEFRARLSRWDLWTRSLKPRRSFPRAGGKAARSRSCTTWCRAGSRPASSERARLERIEAEHRAVRARGLRIGMLSGLEIAMLVALGAVLLLR
jgi:hypothetical protein